MVTSRARRYAIGVDINDGVTQSGLVLPPGTVDPRSHRPIHLQIAEAILDAINDGTLRPGDPLPSKRELQKMTQWGHGAVTNALDYLADMGHIVTSRGRVARVAERQPVVFDDANRWRLFAAEARYRHGRIDDGQAPPEDPDGVGIDWDRIEMTIRRYSIEPAPSIVARRLGLTVGTPCLRREFVEEGPDLPRRLRVSWFEHALVEDTDIADPDMQPWEGGTIDECFTLDRPIGRVEQHVRAVHANENERSELDLPMAAPVLRISRIFYSPEFGGIETSNVVTSGATTAFVAVTDLWT